VSEERFFHVAKGGRLVRLDTAAEAIKLARSAGRDGGFVWLDYCEPSREELSALVDPLGVHPLSIEDCLDANQIPKIEDFPGNTFMLFNTFTYAGRALAVHEIDVIIGRRFLVTVGGRHPEGQPLLHAVEHVAVTDMQSARQGPAYLLHVVLDHIVDQKFAAMEAIEEELNHAEEAIVDETAQFTPGDLLHIRRDLLDLRKSLFHEREILVKICRKDYPFITAKAIYLYRDVYDHLAKFFELTESSREIVTSLMEMYLSMLNNRMALAANETNATVRRLTFITTIFMPLTLLAGIGGMSEWSMMTGPQNWRIAYPAFIGGMVVIGVASYFILKRLAKRDRARKAATSAAEPRSPIIPAGIRPG
jgi:magnesium transporter